MSISTSLGLNKENRIRIGNTYKRINYLSSENCVIVVPNFMTLRCQMEDEVEEREWTLQISPSLRSQTTRRQAQCGGERNTWCLV